jgi:hypothetical protein
MGRGTPPPDGCPGTGSATAGGSGSPEWSHSSPAGQLPFRQSPGPLDRRLNALLLPQHLGLRALPRLELPNVAEIATVELQGALAGRESFGFRFPSTCPGRVTGDPAVIASARLPSDFSSARKASRTATTSLPKLLLALLAIRPPNQARPTKYCWKRRV